MLPVPLGVAPFLSPTLHDVSREQAEFLQATRRVKSQMKTGMSQMPQGVLWRSFCIDEPNL